GVWIILHGKGSSRGTPSGRQLAFGSACLAPGFDCRSSVSLRAQGCKGSLSPGFSAAEMSMMKLRSGPQSPDRSGLPSAVRGAGPDDFALRCSRLVIDRKSTRLNSSHVAISYAVFCLKKKKKIKKNYISVPGGSALTVWMWMVIRAVLHRQYPAFPLALRVPVTF